MDYICNKCYITRARTDRPFRFTQCKHIFCDNCIKDGNNSNSEKSSNYYLSRKYGCVIIVTGRCTVCGFKRPASIFLQEPLPPEVASYFVPLDETLGSLRTAAGIQSVQLNIIFERFHEIVRSNIHIILFFFGVIIIVYVITIFKKNKYYDLKNNYCKVTQKTEYLMQKCNKYKNDIKEMKEAVNYYKDLNSYTKCSSTDSLVSMDIRQENDSCFSVSQTTPATFRVPTSCKVPKSARKYGKSTIDKQTI